MSHALRIHRRSQESRVIALLVRWLILAASVWVAAGLLDGIAVNGWESIFAVAAILGLLNLALKPLLEAFSLPLTVITLGLFQLVINTAVFALTARIALEIDDIHFAIAGVPGDFFWTGVENSFMGALVVGAIAYLLGVVVDLAGRSR